MEKQFISGQGALATAGVLVPWRSIVAGTLLCTTTALVHADSVVEATLSPSWYTASQQYFGESVDLHGEFLIAGAPRTAYNPQGDVYVYQHEAGGVWSEVARLLPPSDVRDVQWFGQSVKLIDDYAFIGAQSATYDVNSSWHFRPVQKTTGAVFVYRKTGSARWEYERRFVSSERYDYYASAIDAETSENGEAYTLVVGAPMHENNEYGRTTGAVYIYEPTAYNVPNFSVGSALPGTAFTSERLVPHDLPPVIDARQDPNADSLRFGHSVDIDDGLILVGAPGGVNAEGRRSQRGRAYLYRQRPLSWQFMQHLHTIGHQYDYGQSVALDGGRALIGNPCIDTRGCGEAHMFSRDASGDFSYSADLIPIGSAQSSGNPLVHFGSAVALHANRALVTAESGQAFLFKSVPGVGWNPLEHWLDSNRPIWASPHSALAIDGEHSAVGNRYHQRNRNGQHTGRVTVRRHEEFEPLVFELPCDWTEINQPWCWP